VRLRTATPTARLHRDRHSNNAGANRWSRTEQLFKNGTVAKGQSRLLSAPTSLFSIVSREASFGQAHAFTSGMKTESQTTNLQAEYGLRWIIAALLILFAIAPAHAAERRSSNANLNITVMVMPIVQAQAIADRSKKAADTALVTYSLQSVAVKQTREVRSISIETKAHRGTVVVLETATTVAD